MMGEVSLKSKKKKYYGQFKIIFEVYKKLKRWVLILKFAQCDSPELFPRKQNSFPDNIDGTQYRSGCSKSPLHVSFNEWMAIRGRRHQVIRWLTSQKDLQKSAVDAAAMDFTVKAKYFYKAITIK